MTAVTSGAEETTASGCRDKQLIYHLTALANLPSIAAHGLLTAAERYSRRLGYVDVGDAPRRAALGLHELVPFHFLPKTPLAYEVAGRPDVGPLVLLCVSRKRARRLAYGVIPHDPLPNGSPSATRSGAQDDSNWDVWGWDEGIERVDWAHIDAGADWRADASRRRALLAEAVSFERVPLRDLSVAYVATAQALAEARRILRPARGIRIIENEWMFPPAAVRWGSPFVLPSSKVQGKEERHGDSDDDQQGAGDHPEGGSGPARAAARGPHRVRHGRA